MEPSIIVGPNSHHLWSGLDHNLNFVSWIGEKSYLAPLPTVQVDTRRFPSGESFCQIKDNIRGRDVYVIQSICAPANDSLMDLLVICDAARRASAGRITAVIPFMGYMRQDRKDKPRVPISAKLVINMLEAAGIDRIITIDVHTLQAQGFTDIPFDHLFSSGLFRGRFQFIKGYDSDRVKKTEVVFVAPDIGAIKRAQAYADVFNVGFAIVNKKRLSPTETHPQSLIGRVEGCEAIITDDLTETCGTLIGAAKICKEHGAANVRVAVTHACFTDEGIKNLKNAMDAGIISEFMTTNTVHCPQLEGIKNVHIHSATELLVSAIVRTNKNQSITDLFDIKGY